MSVELTPQAATEIRTIAQDQKLDLSASWLRVGVKGHGAGRQFTLDLTEKVDDNDVFFTSHGITIACSANDLTSLDGTVIDFRHDDVQGAGFAFDTKEETHVTHAAYDENSPPPTAARVLEALYLVDDPEVGVNIVDLGLLFNLAIEGRDVKLRITMTTPACPLSEHIRGEINHSVRTKCPGIDAIEIQIVWDPKWSPAMMSHEAKKQLGWIR